MKEVKPYKTMHGLTKAIDNGGRFFNLFSHADDNLISRGELAKAAGVFSSGDTAFLFLEMAQHDLPPDDHLAVEQMLEPELREKYRRQRPKTMVPSSVDAKGKAGAAVIVSGFPRFVEKKTEFNGFIMVPITTGNVTTFSMIPIFDQFDVYEVFDDKRMRKPSSVIAKSRGKRLEHNGPVRFGGILRKLQFKKGEDVASLNLTGHEQFSIAVDDALRPGQDVTVTVASDDGKSRTFTVVCRIDTPIEIDYYRNGGILHTVLRRLAQGK